MTGSENYQIKRSPKFEASYKSLIKSHYRKNKQAREKFEKTLTDYFVCLRDNPLEISDKEKFPNGYSVDGMELRKKRWRSLPGLSGAAQYGRLLFLVDRGSHIIYLLWIYTHEEFKKTPPAREIGEQIKYIQQGTAEA